MRALLFGVVGMIACSGTSQPQLPPVRVAIPHPAPFGGPASVVFLDPNEGLVTPTIEDGSWVASVGPDSRVTVTQNAGASPSSITSSTWTVDGIQPGDSFSLQPPPLPAECHYRLVDLIPDGAGGSSWVDPNAAAVDARVISVASNATGPFSMMRTSITIDSETATYVPLQNSMLPSGASVDVGVISCPTANWNDIRTKSLGH